MLIGQATGPIWPVPAHGQGTYPSSMNTHLIVALLASFALAVEDPAGKLTTKKEMKRFLKDKLTSLKPEEVAALGSENKEVCALIKDKEKYVEEKKDSFMRRLRTNLNADCAMAIAKNNPDVFDAMFDDITSQGRRNFFHRLGAITVCNNKEAFSKIDSKIKKALDEYCLEDESKTALADDKKAKQTATETKAGENSANSMTIPTSIAFAVAAVIGIMV